MSAAGESRRCLARRPGSFHGFPALDIVYNIRPHKRHVVPVYGG
jgi:hypothetical protein